VLVSDFHYELPEAQIAQEPLPDRTASRMLHVRRQTGAFEDRVFRDFPDMLRTGDLVVLNNTRVFPARLYGRRSGAKAQTLSPRNPATRDFLHGRVEVLLTRQLTEDPNDWECLVRPGRKIGVGEHLFFGVRDDLEAEVLSRGAFGERRIRFRPTTNFFDLIETLGHVPLPPYIARADRRGIASAIRPSTPASGARSPRRPPGSTSRRKSLASCTNAESKQPNSHCTWA